METTVEFTFRKVVEHAKAVDNYCREHNCIRIMTALFGSQNYGLDEATSDIDTKSIVVPAVDDWLWNTEGDSNHLIIMPDGSHAEMRPVVSMFKQFLKGNINFLEILYTPYLDIADGWEWFYKCLSDHADDIFSYNMYRQSSVWLGFVDQMARRTVKSNSEQGYKEELRYNPKAFMNFLRLKETFTRYFEFHRPLEEALDMTDQREDLLAIKHGFLDWEYVNTLIKDSDTWIAKKKEYIQKHYEDKEVWNAEGYLRELALQTFLSVAKEDVICG